MTRCPQCGVDVAPGRIYCRPSCRAKHEHAAAHREPQLFPPSELTLETELPPEGEARDPRRVRKRT